MRIHKKLCVTLLVGLLILLTGCVKDDSDVIYEENFVPRADKRYDEAMERILDPDSVEELEGDDVFDKVGRIVHRGYRYGLNQFRASAAFIIMVSEVIGLAMILCGNKNNSFRRTGLVVFCIGIPVLIFLLVFGIGIFNNVFLY